MRSFTYADWPSYPLVFLVPSLSVGDVEQEYLKPFGIPTDDVKLIALHLTGKRTSASVMKAFITEELVPAFNDVNAKYIIVTDAGYFKLLTGQASAETCLGYVKDCAYGPYKVVYAPSYKTIFYDPAKIRAKILQSMQALVAHIGGHYEDPGNGIIHSEFYPQTYEEIRDWLGKLLSMDRNLSIDIEAFDLKHYTAGIGTISFCWSKHEGVSFPVDYVPLEGPRREHGETLPYGIQVRNEPVRALLRDFFERYSKKALYHNISYDVYNLIYQLYMSDILDTQGLLKGMEIMLQNWDDTLLITYLATNSCSGNDLGLKENAHEFAGKYMIDVKDITKVPLNDLLRYNLIDGLATWFVYEKNHPRMVADQQLEIYETLFKPSILDIIQMQLTGMPLNMNRVEEVKDILQDVELVAFNKMHSNPLIQKFTYRMNEKWVIQRNLTLKKKRVTLADAKETFNPNSNLQLQDLLYNMLGLPVLDLTKTKQPATGGDTLEKLMNHTSDQNVKDFLQAMLEYNAVNKLLTSFIPAFENAVLGPDGWHYLFGSFKLGGTVSGRLSSSEPNLQNLPATGKGKKLNAKYAKLMKSCFEAPPGWAFCGLDFDSLEDRISALTTKDPEKLKVYTDGYDAHSLRAFAYFSDEMTGIVNTVDSINSIQNLYKDLRQKSKPPTFALTYQGTWMTLVKNCGFSEQLAKQVEARYNKLYKVSIDWVQAKLNEAAQNGYITAAFGLRIRTPLLEQVIRGNSRTPHEAEAEGRTAGNALGQSWCLLTNRASVEFMAKVRNSKYRLDIRPCAHIHDAQYFLIRENVSALLYANTHLVKAVEWQKHPDIQHDDVHLGGTFSIFWPDWSNEIGIPNGADEAGLFEALSKKLERL
jgi:DNA polymerase I